MSTVRPSIAQLDYRQAHASDGVVPHPAVWKSSGWPGIHLELHQQPTFATAEHQHTMHVLAYGVADASGRNAPGWRSLGGRPERERRAVGDIAIIPAGIPHRCSWDDPAQFMVLALEPTLLCQIGQDWVNPDQIELLPQFMSESDGLIQGIFSTLSAEVEIGGIASPLLVDSLKTTLAIHLLRHYCRTSPRLAGTASGLSHLALRRVQDYIDAHLHQGVTLEDMAAIAQLSPYHFLRLFKHHLGMTPHQYVLHRRIDRAKSLLQHSPLSLADIAVRTGFSDQSHLTRWFKRQVGVTPTQFRRRL